ncbi:MAG: undecaprenyl-diphosphate phosphatase [Pirellulales bacterium]
MTWHEAAILGIVEGLTEYLPVSSTGHLLVAQRWMGIGEGNERAKEVANAFAICIQAGAILAVLGLYRGRVAAIGLGLLGRDPAGRRLAGRLAVGLFPAVVVGLTLEKQIKGTLFGGDQLGFWPIVAAWIVGGLGILGVAWWRRVGGRRSRIRGEDEVGEGLEQMTWKQALSIGMLQCVAVWPGVSRSLMTIVGGVLSGLRTPAAVEFSFLLGVLTLGGATLKDAVEFGPALLDHYGAGPLLIGLFFSTISAAISVKWMVGYLQRHGLELFGYYRIAVGVAVGIWLLRGD